MSKKLIILFFFISINVFSQQKTIKHKIQKGETVSSIARKYDISINDIYALNSNAKKVLKLNSVLLIPDLKSKKETKVIDKSDVTSVSKTHLVLPKQTLFGIAKKYKITIADLKKWNPILENSNPEIGQEIFVLKPENNAQVLATTVTQKDEVLQEKPIQNQVVAATIHKIQAKETKFGLAKKYSITVQELEKLNPTIKKKFPIGYALVVPNNNLESIGNNTAESAISKPEIIVDKPNNDITKDKVVAAQIITINDSTTIIKPVIKSEIANELEQRATQNIGAHYRSGGTQPGGFDCSGLMIYAFQNSGIKLPRTSVEQSRFGTTIDKNEAQKGDLIFFSTRGNGISHVGMVLENTNGEIKFIHSANHSGVTISSLNESYYQRTFRHINRVLE